MFNFSKHRLAILSTSMLAAGMLSACSLNPIYHRPAAPVDAAYPDTVNSASAIGADREAATLGWREFFPDQHLQALIAAALNNNRDLRTAILNIEAARAQYNITRADRLPNVNVNASATREHLPAIESPNGQPLTGNIYQANLGLAAFELDFFGRVRSLSQSALASYLATEEARQSVQITLVAQVAQAYLAERSFAEQLAIAQQTFDSRQTDYTLAQKRFDVGIDSALTLSLSNTLVQSARTAIATLKRQRAQADNALTLLIGVRVANLPASPTLSDENIVADIPAGLPSDLLTRRPDIRAAEQRLLATNANIGAARAAFFPRISLTGTFGSASTSLGGLFDSGSGLWSFAPQLTLPIFDGGRNRGNLTLAEVRKNLAVADYEKTIQTAFREVADALVGRETLTEQVEAQEAFLKVTQERVDLTNMRYQNGIASSFDRLDAERELFGAQQALVQARQLRLDNSIDLYRSLGGGLNEVTGTALPAAAPVPGLAVK
ncbi:MAG: multidrug transporter [Herbaspirillum sp.]|nr:multidrug transporter [Herbaspirillum sp.]